MSTANTINVGILEKLISALESREVNFNRLAILTSTLLLEGNLTKLKSIIKRYENQKELKWNVILLQLHLETARPELLAVASSYGDVWQNSMLNKEQAFAAGFLKELCEAMIGISPSDNLAAIELAKLKKRELSCEAIRLHKVQGMFTKFLEIDELVKNNAH